MGGLAPWAQVLPPLLLSLVGIPPYSTVHEPLKHKLRGDYKKKFLQKISWISDLPSKIFILPKILIINNNRRFEKKNFCRKFLGP